jgi:hypothetical protein
VQNRLGEYAAAPVATGPGHPRAGTWATAKARRCPRVPGTAAKGSSPHRAAGRSTSRLVVYGRRSCDGAAANPLIPR